MNAKILLGGSALALAVALSGQALAQPFNQPPPTGAILDLAGSPATNSGQQYSVDFSASLANTAITFAFRQDPSFESLWGVSVVDLSTLSGNLLTNGDFSGGTYTDGANSSTPNGWTYANIYGATFGGVVQSGDDCSGSPSGFCWYDGAVQAYDAISQTISTHVGDNYQISFFLNAGSVNTPSGNYQGLSTNGDITDAEGDGIDVLVYAQAGLPAAGGVPEPATWAMMILGFGGIGAVLRGRRRFNAATA